MRTTLTLDDNLLITLKKKAAEKDIPFKTLVNQALQRGLEDMETAAEPEQKYRTPVRSLGLKSGYDLDKIGQIADEMEDEEQFGILQ